MPERVHSSCARYRQPPLPPAPRCCLTLAEYCATRSRIRPLSSLTSAVARRPVRHATQNSALGEACACGLVAESTLHRLLGAGVAWLRSVAESTLSRLLGGAGVTMLRLLGAGVTMLPMLRLLGAGVTMLRLLGAGVTILPILRLLGAGVAMLPMLRLLGAGVTMLRLLGAGVARPRWLRSIILLSVAPLRSVLLLRSVVPPARAPCCACLRRARSAAFCCRMRALASARSLARACTTIALLPLLPLPLLPLLPLALGVAPLRWLMPPLRWLMLPAA